MFMHGSFDAVRDIDVAFDQTVHEQTQHSIYFSSYGSIQTLLTIVELNGHKYRNAAQSQSSTEVNVFLKN